MTFTTIPGPQETLDDLDWLHPEMFRALEYGGLKAKEYFDTESIAKEQSIFSGIVRLHARAYLQSRGIEAMEVERVTLCGLSLRVPKYAIKIWKTEDEGLPNAGTSTPKQMFYQQSLFSNGMEITELNLAVLWNQDPLSNLAALWLVCPKYGDERSAETYWTIRIPDPTLRVSSPAPTENPPDLPMTPIRDAGTGTGNDGI
jgi:hypothetical protein